MVKAVHICPGHGLMPQFMANEMPDYICLMMNAKWIM